MKSNALASVKKQKLQNAAPQPDQLIHLFHQLQYNKHWNTAGYDKIRLCLSDNSDWDKEIKESENEKREKEKKTLEKKKNKSLSFNYNQ